MKPTNVSHARVDLGPTRFAGERDAGKRRRHPVDVPLRPSSLPFGSRDEAVRQRAREIMTKAIRRRATRDPHHPVGRLRRLLRRARRRHPATFRRRAGVGGGTGRSGAGDAGGGDHGYRVYELHQQVEKVGRDAFVTVVHRLSRRRQPQRTGTT